jgi:hypothetical protein
MIENLPAYVPAFFILITLITVGFVFFAVAEAVDSRPVRSLIFAAVGLWLALQAALGIFGFFVSPGSFPPRIFAFGAMPALVAATLGGFLLRSVPSENAFLRILTLLHIIRVPVEITLYWLYQNGLVPREMTFDGRNFDILSGLTAPLVYCLAFRNGRIRRRFLFIWNLAALALLVNIVATAILAFPSPIQSIAFEQPNRAVMYFPFVWLPAVVVPIVFFAHLAAISILLKRSAA